MRKLIVMMLLAIVSSGAAAEWVKIREAGFSSGYDYYADPVTIRRSGDVVKMLTMNDFKTKQIRTSGYQYLSSTAQNEYDCKRDRLRMLSSVLYEKNMATGFSLDTSIDSSNWKAVTPGSIDEAAWKLACGKF